MKLIKNIEVYSPKYLGVKDVLISNGKVSLVEDSIDRFHKKVELIDGSGKKLMPGLIDNHVHITGGGGEGSFKTRVPEISLSDLTKAGITTVVGMLGTDSTTRSVENLVAKAKGLKEEGLSVYVHTGAYSYPSPTVTGDVKKDIMFVEEIIGAKVALSDHRSSSLRDDELARLASEARVAGMMGGKAGIVVAHMGDGEDGLGIVNRVLEDTEVPIKTIRPTHVNRKQELLIESFDYGRRGGIIDLTCGIYDKLSPAKVIVDAKKQNVPLENILISSDGHGSFSEYDIDGKLIEIGVSSVGSLVKEFVKLVVDEGLEIEEALRFFTTNVSKALDLYPEKGVIMEGSDADFLIMDEDMNIDTVIARGNIMVQAGEVVRKGTYE